MNSEADVFVQDSPGEPLSLSGKSLFLPLDTNKIGVKYEQRVLRSGPGPSLAAAQRPSGFRASR